MKIDTTKIEGYDAMSAEDKVKMFEAYEFEAPKAAEPAFDEKTYKEAISRANSQAAEYKRQLREKQTEAEREKAEREEAEKTMREELAAYKHKDTVSTYTTQYMSMGYDATLAAATAEAMAKGDMATVFANQAAFIEAHDKAIGAAAVKSTPAPASGKMPEGEEELDRLMKWAGL